VINLNQAATTWPKPACVTEAMTAAFSAPPPGQFRSGAGGDGADIMEDTRQQLADLLGIGNPGRVFFASGATDAANALIRGLPLAGRRVLASQTEHNSVLRPLMNLRRHVGKVDIIPCDENGTVSPEAVSAMLEDPAAAVFISHCSNVTGAIQDLAAIGEIVHRKGAMLVVDVAQSAGCLPVGADAWGVDALIVTGHKGLFGPQGTGAYYVRPGLTLEPFRFGGTGRNSSQLLYSPEDYEYEPGTQNLPGIAALGAGIRWCLSAGVENIAKQERRLIARLRDGLRSLPGVHVYANGLSETGPVLSFTLAGLSPADLAYILSGTYDIRVRAGLHCAPLIHRALGTENGGTLRVSVSALTREAEIDQFLCAMGEIAAAQEVRS